MSRRWSSAALAGALTALCTPEAAAQDNCRFVCAPVFLVEPTITIEPLGSNPRVSEDGSEPERGRRETFFETVFALDVPTTIPWLGFTLEAIVAPFGKTSVNPFTGESAEAIGGDVRDNAVEIESEVNFTWLDDRHTGGWVGSHFDIVDKFSPAEQPGARSVYTHKLNFELDTTLAIFKWMPEGHWLREVELEGSLDYLATGLPRKGDLLNGERFLDDANPWSFSIVFVLPVLGW